jgi:L-alanine-DL-glutamate epimerase-like enolase superfamily enzyme
MYTRKILNWVRPYTIAYKTVTSVENVIVQLVLSNGIVGYGAANPSKPVVGVSVEDSFHTLQQDDFAWLLGRDIREYRQLCHELRLRYGADVGAITALDIALHDAFTRYFGYSVGEIF